MAIVTKTRTYNPGDQLTAGYYNADRDEIIAGVNSITNAQIASNAAILESKILFNGSSGHSHTGGTDGKKLTTGSIDLTGFFLPESQVTFDPLAGHIHDGVFSTKVPVVNLDPVGLTPLEFVRVDVTGTVLETAPVNAVQHRAFGFVVSDTLVVGSNSGWNPVVPENMTAIAIYGVVKTASTGADIIVEVAISGGATIGTVTIPAGSQSALGTINSATLTQGDVLVINVLQVGTGPTGSDLSVTLECSEP